MYNLELNKLKRRVLKLENCLRKLANLSGFHINTELDFIRDEPTRDSKSININIYKCVRESGEKSASSKIKIPISLKKKNFHNAKNKTQNPTEFPENIPNFHSDIIKHCGDGNSNEFLANGEEEDAYFILQDFKKDEAFSKENSEEDNDGSGLRQSLDGLAISKKSTGGNVTGARVIVINNSTNDENAKIPEAENEEILFKIECSEEDDLDSQSDIDIGQLLKIVKVEQESESESEHNEESSLYEPLVVGQQSSSSLQLSNPFVALEDLDPSKIPQRKCNLSSNSGKHPFKCPHCHKYTDTDYNFKRHLKTHTATRKNCYFCPRSFKTEYSHKDHMKHHTMERHYPCPHCKKTFQTSSECKNHVEKSHPDCLPLMSIYRFQPRNKRHKCEKCAYSSNYPHDLRRHVNFVHNKLAMKCYFCPHKFKNISNGRKHLRKHTKERPENVNKNLERRHNCPDCFYKTDRTSLMKSHVKSKHGKAFVEPNRRIPTPFKCLLCPFHTPVAGERKTYIGKHVKLHHTEASGGVQCPHCQFKLKRKSVAELVQHIANAHPTDYSLQMKEFGCTVCDYKCKNQILLQKHMVSRHTNNEEFILCHLCPYKTLDKDNFTHHVRKQHKNKK